MGPITAQFKGAANFVERNDQDHKAVLSGKGRDTRGAGNASALITAKLEAVSDSITRVNVDTDIKITGKFAQSRARSDGRRERQPDGSVRAESR